MSEGMEGDKVKTTKKWAIALGAILVLWLLVSLALPPKLHAKSEDGKWKAVYNVSNTAKGFWSGDLYWEGVEGKITALQFFENDQQLTGDIEISESDYINLSAEESCEFVFMGEEPKESSDYSLLIRWENEGEEFEQTLVFDKEKRLFVVPRFE